MTKPKLRNVAVQKAVINGSPFLVLTDPEHFAKQMLVIPDNQAMPYILGCLDGEHTVPEIQEDFMRTFGILILTDQISEIINTLDDNLYLENEGFLAFKQGLMDDFRNSSLRSSSLAGASYPRERNDVEILMESMLEQGKLKENAKVKDTKEIRGLIAPHIDFIRGGHIYGAVYNVLPVDFPPDVFIILGTAHSPSSSLFVPTRKSFETPLGITRTSTEILDEIEKAIAPDVLYRDEFLHKGEHSIEFQVLWLQYLFKECDSLRILPILCASIEHFMEQGIKPDQNEEYTHFLNTLTNAIAGTGQRAVVIAGADLSHVGASFGDPFPDGAPESFLEETRVHDQWILEALQSRDAPEFYERIASCANRYRICGLAPIYAMLQILDILEVNREEKNGIIIDYDQSLDSERTTSVSFTGMVFS
jgi:AmmeMemoRadiSam system protein B